jgi:hypothetical protein
VTALEDPARRSLIRRGFALEWMTLGWNVAGIIVLAFAAVTARSVALAGFGLDSLIEIGASTVVIWDLSGTGEERQRKGLRLIGGAFAALAVYLLVQSTLVLATGYHPRHSVPGIIWTALTAAVMFALAVGKSRTGRALDNPVLRTEGRVTMIDGILATAVLAGLALNAALGWWWADPAAGYVLVVPVHPGAGRHGRLAASTVRDLAARLGSVWDRAQQRPRRVRQRHRRPSRPPSQRRGRTGHHAQCPAGLDPRRLARCGRHWLHSRLVHRVHPGRQARQPGPLGRLRPHHGSSLPGISGRTVTPRTFPVRAQYGHATGTSAAVAPGGHGSFVLSYGYLAGCAIVSITAAVARIRTSFWPGVTSTP